LGKLFGDLVFGFETSIKKLRGLGKKSLVFGLESPETTVAPPPAAISGDGKLERGESVLE
jgi:hypothetical protein